jgi:hypothetical protein
MTLDQAKSIIGNKCEWELKHIIRALNTFSFLNNPDDNERLQAAKVLLKYVRSNQRA